MSPGPARFFLRSRASFAMVKPSTCYPTEVKRSDTRLTDGVRPCA